MGEDEGGREGHNATGSGRGITPISKCPGLHYNFSF